MVITDSERRKNEVSVKMNLTYFTLELVTGFFLLFIIVKILGKKIINQITPFTLKYS